ncbi:sugar transferase [Novosphingobium sp. Gsoil 351]|uniref:sugar transferase n=1 Tax=Novosphingobium sp. Gsoil 351 TaxID=2675225 RepID=UPI0012B4843E|nr:sugar transferase [Novosphingobium sp. Gsoil 351]QGN54951.1 sugar transferase [Novosphingobium sp. Gsoil 351]
MTPAKRLFDIAAALGLLLVLALPLALIALIVRIRDGRPIFYISERMRTVEQPFALIKFRTMAEAGDDSGVSGGDKLNRITPTGRFLRRYRLDELPQLFNVLRGDLTFVGPRPPLRQYVERFPELYARVLRSRPGVTGLASIVYHDHEERLLARSRSAEETDAIYCRSCVPRKARLDLVYQRHSSLCWDVLLMLQTTIGVRASGQRRRH